MAKCLVLSRYSGSINPPSLCSYLCVINTELESQLDVIDKSFVSDWLKSDSSEHMILGQVLN